VSVSAEAKGLKKAVFDEKVTKSVSAYSKELRDGREANAEFSMLTIT
jgi:hypothetical protein